MEMDSLQLPSTSSVLSIPRTPGDASQGRTRKCSIVQEEEEEEYGANVADERELTPPLSSLNRRGSRSEGKLNIAVQVCSSKRCSDSGYMESLCNFLDLLLGADSRRKAEGEERITEWFTTSLYSWTFAC